MYPFIQKFHSGWAYIVLLLVLIAIINAIIGLSSKKEFTTTNRKFALFGLIAIHIQLLIGLILYFVSPLGLASLGEMAESDIRTPSLEHPLMVIIGIALITIGWSKHKKAEDSISKFKKIAVYYGIGLALILSKIPWKLWF